MRDAAISGTLRDEGRFLASIDLLDDLWREYPDLPQVESAAFALTQSLYAQADNADTLVPRKTDDDPVKPVRLTKTDVIREVIGLLNRFLTLYPESPVADQAAYSLANATLELTEYQQALALCGRLTERFDESRYVDRFQYIKALAHFHLGQYDEAIALADVVAESRYTDARGVVQPSPNKWLALYMIGQVHHARGHAEPSIAYYEKVRDRFPDAAEAINYFTARHVRIPEVTVFHPAAEQFYEAEALHTVYRLHAQALQNGAGLDNGVPAWVKQARGTSLPRIRIDYRNIGQAHLQVYRVDLMKLYLLEKNLSTITSVNLAGIKPALVKTVALGDGKDYIDKSRMVDLDIREEGAYLVICRGDELFASGLVLLTPVRLDVQEDPPAGRVRVNVVNALNRERVKHVHVKVIGSANDEFVSGETDLRGVFVADSIRGVTTVIARDSANRYAFYRGRRPLGTPPPPARGRTMVRSAKGAETSAIRAKSKADYLSNLAIENRDLQAGNQLMLDTLFKQQQRGVQIRKTQ